MIFTMFASFTVVNAAETPAITGTATKNGDTVTLTVDYSGFTKVSVAQFTATLPTEVFEALEKDENDEFPAAKAEDAFSSATINYTNEGKLIFIWAAQRKAEWAAGEGTLATITLKVKSGADIPENIAFSSVIFQDETTVDDVATSTTYGTEDQKPQNAITVNNATIVDPNATPKPKDRPTTNDESAPVVTTPVEGQQINATADLDKDGKTVTLKVSYSGFTKVSVAQFTATLPTSVFEALEKDENDEFPAAKAEDAFSSATINYTNEGKLIFIWAAQRKAEWTAGEGDLATITLTLKDGVKLPQDIALSSIIFQDETTVDDVATSTTYGTEDQKPQNSIGVTNATVAEPEKEYSQTNLALSKAVGNTTTTGSDDTTDGSTPYYVAITATKSNGEPAVYGDDYVAYYKGIKLTEGQLNNYLAGAYGSISDALENITFSAESGVQIAAELNKTNATTGKNEKISEGTVGSTTGTGATPTPTPAAIAVKGAVTGVTGDTKSVGIGQIITLTATMSNLKDSQKGGTYTFTFDNADQTVLSVNTDAATVDDKGTIKYEGLAEGSAKVNVAYVKDGVTIDSTPVTIKVTTLANSDDDSTTSSGGGGSKRPIANGSTVTTTTNSPYANVAFTDLDDASWAKQAIVGLAAKGIVSGRGDGTFDPNANITRAEYCQILIGAIEKTNASADVSFDDVATDAWYYHAVAVASQLGIVSGYGDGNFGPNDLITRQDMALMTYKAALATSTDLTATRSLVFGDSAEISDYAAEAVQTLANAGIISGMSDEEFAPKANATRAQASVIIYNTFVK
jgi:hypothetical protein